MWSAAIPGLLMGGFGGGVAASAVAGGISVRLAAGALLGLMVGAAVLRALRTSLATRDPAGVRVLAVAIGAAGVFLTARALT